VAKTTNSSSPQSQQKPKAISIQSGGGVSLWMSRRRRWLEFFFGILGRTSRQHNSDADLLGAANLIRIVGKISLDVREREPA
jgi:hypothetical protein